VRPRAGPTSTATFSPASASRAAKKPPTAPAPTVRPLILCARPARRNPARESPPSDIGVEANSKTAPSGRTGSSSSPVFPAVARGRMTGLWSGLMLGALSGRGDVDGGRLLERKFDGGLRVA